MSSTRGAVGALEQREAPLDDDLRLRTRHERARVGLQRQAAEAPLAEHVRERLARLATREQRLDGAVDLAVEVGVEAAARRAGDVREQKLRVDARRVDPGGCEALLGCPQCVAELQSPSARRRSSVVSAAVKSSSSPWRMRSSWWTVSLIRWSVRRFSGKL